MSCNKIKVMLSGSSSFISTFYPTMCVLKQKIIPPLKSNVSHSRINSIHSGPHALTIKLQQLTEQIKNSEKWSQNKMSNDSNKHSSTIISACRVNATLQRFKQQVGNISLCISNSNQIRFDHANSPMEYPELPAVPLTSL